MIVATTTFNDQKAAINKKNNDLEVTLSKQAQWSPEVKAAKKIALGSKETGVNRSGK